jgi:hypothetical protein
MAKIRQWFPWLALALILAGQLNYLPDRIFFFKQTLALAQADSRERLRLAYGAADYDLLAWVADHTPSDTILLLLTASPHTYGDPAYVLYHRAIYHLSPRTVWWAAPVAPTRYPAWWSFTDLTPLNILSLAEMRQADVILAAGFPAPPLAGEVISYSENIHLIFLSGTPPTALPSSLQASSSVEICHGLGGALALCSLFTLLKMLGAILAILAWGDLLQGWLQIRFHNRSLMRRLAISWLWGAGLTSLATFVLLWLGWSLFSAVVSLSVLGVLLWFWGVFKELSGAMLRGDCPLRVPVVRRGFGNPRRAFPKISDTLKAHLNLCRTFLTRKPLATLFLVILLLQTGWILFVALISPLADWDAWVNWASKANLIFIEQTISPNLYHNPARLPTNMDYPLLLPLLESWFYTWLGQIYEPAVGLISFLFYLALLALFYEAVRSQVSATTALGFTALLTTTPRLERPAASGLADIPLAALFLLALLLLFYEYNQDESRAKKERFGLGVAFSIGLLPRLKNEGWLWWGVVILFILALYTKPTLARPWVTDHAASETKPSAQWRTGWIVGGLVLFLALALPLLWQIFLALHGTYRFTFMPLTPTNLVSHLPRLPLIWLEMGKRLLNPYWNSIWLLGGGLLLFRRGHIFQERNYLAWLIVLVGIYLFLVSFTYIFSRFDPYLAHLNNSVERLMLQAIPLVWWWVVGQSVRLGWLKSNQENQ